MPLVANTELPSFARLRERGQEILTHDRARAQDIRELHVGLLNLMPDAALEATERQFLRLVGSCNRIAQFYVHPFTVDGVPREGSAKTHVAKFYKTFAQVREEGLDALIITGANPIQADLTVEPFWQSLVDVMTWAREEVCSTLYSCLATHAALQQYHGIFREKLPSKRWGVYEHRVTGTAHPLLLNINTRFDGPHSHVYDMPRSGFEAAGTTVLVDGPEAGVYLAVSEDQFRSIYFQGHPEYDINSLFKEFKREVGRFVSGVHKEYPPFPQHYFATEAQAVLRAYEEQVHKDMASGRQPPELPEAELGPLLDNTWTDTGKALINNWLGLVYQLTHTERRRPFMEHINPDDPLGLRTT